MSYKLTKEQMNQLFSSWRGESLIFAPTLKKDFGRFSDVDQVIYDFVEDIDQVVFDKKSDYAFKEAFLPLSETLFFFTEHAVTEAEAREKEVIVFLRSCDLHGVKRLDELYLKNGDEDYYYKRLREHAKFVLMGCETPFDNCFCSLMETNKSQTYHAGIDRQGERYILENQTEEWDGLLKGIEGTEVEHVTSSVDHSSVELRIPEEVSLDIFDSDIWEEYNDRCINCGRCNFVCPTCTCFTMQDIFYQDNAKVGERRRVNASCMVDGFTDVAGGGAYRKEIGARMRFRTLHKFYDYKKRFGHHMCVGCGRCTDVCPQYITITGAINKVYDQMAEVKKR